ncbi:hypothetical protein ACFSSA_05115 [Luteolibacter algae]|uniref:PEP-CTERM sorting domain-containing protein n=1 Tax=Luteolibacter algae TaxID=454151 RepID=A0ABW5D7R3_9BACT
MIRNSSPTTATCALVFSLSFASLASAGLSLTTSTFDNDDDGWRPWATSTESPITAGNPYLKLDSDGAEERGRLITFSRETAWTGDYISMNVTAVELDVANFSSSDTLHLRVALGTRASPMQSGGTWFVSSAAVIVGTLSDWTHVSLSVAENELSRVGNFAGEIGTDTYAEALSNIQTIRLFSAVQIGTAIGDEFIGPVGFDNISLIVPEPSSSAFIVFSSLIFCLRRKRRH